MALTDAQAQAVYNALRRMVAECQGSSDVEFMTPAERQAKKADLEAFLTILNTGLTNV